jgi:hypothetical protein
VELKNPEGVASTVVNKKGDVDKVTYDNSVTCTSTGFPWATPECPYLVEPLFYDYRPGYYANPRSFEELGGTCDGYEKALKKYGYNEALERFQKDPEKAKKCGGKSDKSSKSGKSSESKSSKSGKSSESHMQDRLRLLEQEGVPSTADAWEDVDKKH